MAWNVDDSTLGRAGLVVPIGELAAKAGEHLGYSRWHEITQDQVNHFADTTGDHQWIHQDVDRARAGPFGGTIAHGYLTLSLMPMLLWQILEVEGASAVINYGLNRVRFPTPVPVGAKLRLAAELAAVDEVNGGLQATVRGTIEVEEAEKPACVAEILLRYYF
jgi:acyl dehydratase